MDLKDFDQLEAKLARLLDNHQKVKQEKESAEKLLKEKEAESNMLKGRIQQYEKERNEMRDRLERILGHFERLDLP